MYTYIYISVYVYIYIYMYIYTYAKDIFQDHQRHERFGRLGAPFFRRPTKKVRKPMELGMREATPVDLQKSFLCVFFPTRKWGVVFRNQK